MESTQFKPKSMVLAASIFIVGSILLILASCKKDSTTETGLKNEVKIYEQDGLRIIESNGVPDHDYGVFPNANDPNPLLETDNTYKMPLNPVALTTAIPSVAYVNGQLQYYRTGVFLNGCTIDANGPFYIHNEKLRAIQFPFDGIESGWEYEGLSQELGMDTNNAHTQPPGLYHYHGKPTLYLEKKVKEKGTSKMILLGYLADGFPIYYNLVHSSANSSSSSLVAVKSSYRLRTGTRPLNPSNKPTAPEGAFNGEFVQDYEYIQGLGDLDECNGRFGVTPEYPSGTYYYVLTDDWPFIPRLFRGAPHISFRPNP